MDEKTTGIVSYLWWVGLLIAVFTTKDKTEYTRFHMRQSLGLLLLSFFGTLVLKFVSGSIGYFLAMVISVGALALWIFAFIGALNGEKKMIPVLGDKFQEWFKNVFA